MHHRGSGTEPSAHRLSRKSGKPPRALECMNRVLPSRSLLHRCLWQLPAVSLGSRLIFLSTSWSLIPGSLEPPLLVRISERELSTAVLPMTGVY